MLPGVLRPVIHVAVHDAYHALATVVPGRISTTRQGGALRQEQIARHVGRQVVRAVLVRRPYAVRLAHPETIDVTRRSLATGATTEGRKLAEAEDLVGPAIATQDTTEAVGTTAATEADLLDARRLATIGERTTTVTEDLAATPTMATAMRTEAVVVPVVVGHGGAWSILLQGIRLEADLVKATKTIARGVEGPRLAAARAARHAGVQPTGVEEPAVATARGHRRGQDQEACGTPHAGP